MYEFSVNQSSMFFKMEVEYEKIPSFRAPDMWLRTSNFRGVFYERYDDRGAADSS